MHVWNATSMSQVLPSFCLPAFKKCIVTIFNVLGAKKTHNHNNSFFFSRFVSGVMAATRSGRKYQALSETANVDGSIPQTKEKVATAESESPGESSLENVKQGENESSLPKPLYPSLDELEEEPNLRFRLSQSSNETDSPNSSSMYKSSFNSVSANDSHNITKSSRSIRDSYGREPLEQHHDKSMDNPSLLHWERGESRRRGDSKVDCRRSWTDEGVNERGDLEVDSRSSLTYHRLKISNILDQKCFHNFCIICVLVMFSIGILYLNAQGYNQEQAPVPKSPRDEVVKIFDEQFKDIIAKFPNQDRRFWKIVKAACKGVLKERSPMQPAVVMLVAHKDHAQTAECIADHITRTFSVVHGSVPDPFLLNAQDYAKYPNPDDLKLHIDTSLRSAFEGNEGCRATKISQLQYLPGGAAAMFHAFCDNENAPFQDVAIVFTLHTDVQLRSDSQVERYLMELWGGNLDIDTLAPLLTRIANSIAMVQEESEYVIRKHCQITI